MTASKSAPALQLGFNDLNLYSGGGVGASSTSGMPGGAGSSVNWNASFDPSSSQQQQQRPGNVGGDDMSAEQPEQETDLGRSDTVRASLHRRAHSHLDMSAAASSSQQRQSIPGPGSSSLPMDHASLSQPLANPQPHSLPPSQSDLFNQLGAGSDDPNSSFEFDPYGVAVQRHSRPGSSASAGSFSNEGDIGHPLGNPAHYGITQQQQPQIHHHQHLSGGDLDDGAYYSSEGDFNDFDGLDYMEGMEGADGLALVDSLGIPGGYGGIDPSGLSTSPYSGGMGGYGTSPGSSPGFPGMLPPGGLGYGGPNTAPLAGRSSLGSSSSFPHDPSLPHPPMSAPPGSVPGGMGGMPGGGGGGVGGAAQVPMSSTLAVIKAQAFGTSRKARTRAKRPGADSAAKVAMEVLQARAQGLGLDVDLSVEGAGEGAGGEGGLRRGGASVSRSGATLKRRPKPEESSPQQ